jgi:polar amino acid transport system substrate-binding protein
VDIARLVADSLGLELNVVPTSWEDWPLGVASGKYDAAISNITVTKERKEKFDFATYRKDSLGFYVKSPARSSRLRRRKTSPGCGLSSAPAPTRRPSCWRGMPKT